MVVEHVIAREEEKYCGSLVSVIGNSLITFTHFASVMSLEIDRILSSRTIGSAISRAIIIHDGKP